MSVVKLMKHIGLSHALMPMTGTMKRNPDGSKDKKGVFPPGDFLAKAREGTHEPVYEQTPHYAMVSGVKNVEGRQLVCIDTDNKQSTNKMLKMIELEHKNYHFIWHSFYHSIKDDSHVRAKALFWATKEMLEAFPKNYFNGDIHVDTLIHHTVYCPCPGNQCVHPWEWDGVSEIVDIPRSVLIWLKLEKEKLVSKQEVRTTQEEQEIERREGFHVDDLEHFVKTGEIKDELQKVWFKPAEYREGRRKNGDRINCVSKVPTHSGNSFFKRISGIMTGDISVTAELAEKVILKVNEIWAEKGSGPKDDIENTVIKPFIHNRVAEGNWDYDANWKERLKGTLKFKDKEGDEWEIFTDEAVSEYIAACKTSRRYEYFERNRDKVVEFCVVNGLELSKKTLVTIPSKKIVTDITLPFGDTPEGEFNFFRQNPYLECIQNPNKYSGENGRRIPKEFLLLLKHNIQDDADEAKFLWYVTTYLRTGRNPLLNFYFTGPQGSGKSQIGEVLMEIMGKENCLSILKTVHFMESYTDKFRNKYIIQLEEIKDQLDTGGGLDREFLGQLKTFTSLRPAPLRRMRTTGLIDYDARWLFLLNCNLKEGEKLNLPPDERRGVVFESSCHLEDSELYLDWADNIEEDIGDKAPINHFLDSMHSEKGLLDIAWYLTTTYPIDMSGSEWARRWPTKASIKMTEGRAFYEDNFIVSLKKEDLVSIYADALKEGVNDLFVEIPARDGLFMPSCALLKLFKAKGRKKTPRDLAKIVTPIFGPEDTGYVVLNRSPFNSHIDKAKENLWPLNHKCPWKAFKLTKFGINYSLEELKKRALELKNANSPFKDQTDSSDEQKQDQKLKPVVKGVLDRNVE